MAKTDKTGSLSSEGVNPAEGANPGVSEVDVAALNAAILEAVKSWEEEHVGFPPYWNPETPGAAALGILMMKDTTDPNFVRYVFQASRQPIACKRGPANMQESVIVKPGEMFTMSTYAGLPIDILVGLEVGVIAEAKDRLPPNEASDGRPRDFWRWRVVVPPGAKKEIAARRKQLSDAILKESIKGAALPAKSVTA